MGLVYSCLRTYNVKSVQDILLGYRTALTQAGGKIPTVLLSRQQLSSLLFASVSSCRPPNWLLIFCLSFFSYPYFCIRPHFYFPSFLSSVDLFPPAVFSSFLPFSVLCLFIFDISIPLHLNSSVSLLISTPPPSSLFIRPLPPSLSLCLFLTHSLPPPSPNGSCLFVVKRMFVACNVISMTFSNL